MNDNSTLLMTCLSSALLLAGGACRGTLPQGTGSGGTSGAGGGVGNPTGEWIPLPSSATGFVEDLAGGSNLIGPWHAYGDGVGPNASPANGADAADSDCQSASKGGFPASACSQIAWPRPGQPFPPSDLATSKMCTDGVAALAMAKGGSPDYVDLWGAGIALDFNNPGGDAGVKGDLDLSGYQGIMFDFSAFTGNDPSGAASNGAGPPAGALRVNFPFTGDQSTNPPYWMGAAAASSPLIVPPGGSLHVEVLWRDVASPNYITQQSAPGTPPDFNPAKVQSMQFQVFSNATTTTPYAFCVADLALLSK
jgi:hypothetical protein